MMRDPFEKDVAQYLLRLRHEKRKTADVGGGPREFP